MNVLIMIFTFIISTILSVLLMSKRQNKWLALLSAFLINTFILAVSAWFQFSIDEESRKFGIDYSGRYVLIGSIPILTWINGIIIIFIKNKGTRHKQYSASNK